MATLFSGPKGFFRSLLPGVCRVAFLFFSTTYCGNAEGVAKLGYVISAKDRAQADAEYQAGFAAYQSGDYPRALSLIEHADLLKPDQPDGWNLRGMVFLRQKAFDKAQVAFARAVALDPDLWAAHFNAAETSFQQQNYPRARKAFEGLLAQTNRFKNGSRWELVQYKAFLCCLLQGNAKEAEQKLARLPKTGGVTPARLYAEAATAYQRKQTAAAQKSVSAAQAAFPAPVTDLFSEAFVQAGWQSAPVSPSAATAGDAGLPPGVTLATTIPGRGSVPYYTADPKLEAAVAEPLPLPDAGVHPIVGKLNPALQNLPSNLVAAPQKRPASPVVAARAAAPPATTPDVELEHRDLLLVE